MAIPSLVTADLATELVTVPYVPFILSVALKFSVLCVKMLHESTNKMFSIVEVYCCLLAVLLWVQPEGVASFDLNLLLITLSTTKLAYSSFLGYPHLNCFLNAISCSRKLRLHNLSLVSILLLPEFS